MQGKSQTPINQPGGTGYERCRDNANDVPTPKVIKVLVRKPLVVESENSTRKVIDGLFGDAVLVRYHDFDKDDRHLLLKARNLGMIRELHFSVPIGLSRHTDKTRLRTYHYYISRDFHRGRYFFRPEDMPKAVEMVADAIIAPFDERPLYAQGNIYSVRAILRKAGFSQDEARNIIKFKFDRARATHHHAETIKLRGEEQVA